MLALSDPWLVTSYILFVALALVVVSRITTQCSVLRLR